MRAVRTVAPVLVVLAVAALGTAGTVAAQDGPVTFSVVIARGRIIPAQLDVPAGRKIRLALRNEGPGPAEFENLKLRIEKVLASGVSSVVVIHPLRPGSYRFVDEFHPDTGQLLLVAR